MKKYTTAIFTGILLLTSGVRAETIEFLNETIETNSLSGFMQVAIAISKWILGIVGSVALLMFVYGGIMFLISGGSSERVEKGKQIIIGSVIGLVIVFASYTIIGFVFHSLGIDAGTSGWASSDWFKNK